jgi:hypothetical protein
VSERQRRRGKAVAAGSDPCRISSIVVDERPGHPDGAKYVHVASTTGLAVGQKIEIRARLYYDEDGAPS